MANSGIAERWPLAHAEKDHLTDFQPRINRERLQLPLVL
jgi:hypothetical protein